MNRIKHRATILAALVILFAYPGLVSANGDGKGGAYGQHEMNGSDRHHDRDGGNRSGRNGGNETTGQLALWLLVAANLPVLVGIADRSINRFVRLEPGRKEFVKRINKFRKRKLMGFHYVLNPVGISAAFLHFLLSSCRSSPLPEWGLFLLALTAMLGWLLKSGSMPQQMRKFAYRLHTSSSIFFIIAILIGGGHLLIE